MEAIRRYYLDQFFALRRREMDLGSTLTGPHKDDIMISINDNDARFFASEGQQRSCIAALRLAEWSRLYSLSDEPPLMLVDDIGTSLDDKRRANFLKQLGGVGQVFISTTNPLTVSANKEEKSFRIANGKVEEEQDEQKR